MKISRRTVRGCRVAILLGILLLLANAIWHPLEPRYQGKRLSVLAKILSAQGWDDYSSEERELFNPHEAAEAVRHIGTKALPYALKWCNAHDSELTEKFKDWVNEQTIFKVRIPSDAHYHERGIAVFNALGPIAKPAIPLLIEVFHKGDSRASRIASDALRYIGPDAIPPLMEALTNVNDEVRMYAAVTLGNLEMPARVAIPGLIRCLQDETPQVRSEAALSLARFSEDFETVIPALLPCLQDKDMRVRQHAAMALGHIGKEPEKVVPALVACIEAETNRHVSLGMLAALGRFGTNANSAIPMLVKMIETNQIGFYSGALGALRKIDPDTAKVIYEKHLLTRTNAVPGQ